MIYIKKFTFNPFQENTYILYDESRACVIIDPGCYEREEKEELVGFISENKLNPLLLLNTHCHIDHVLGNNFVKETYGVPLLIHREDEPVLRAVQTYASNYGFENYEPAEADAYLEEGENISFGNSVLEVLFVPGHAPGHVAFYCPEQAFVINGDVLFRGSVGRTDLPGGNMDILLKSIAEKLFPLPGETVVWCGHGPETELASEKATNPFCAGINT